MKINNIKKYTFDLLSQEKSDYFCFSFLLQSIVLFLLSLVVISDNIIPIPRVIIVSDSISEPQEINVDPIEVLKFSDTDSFISNNPQLEQLHKTDQSIKVDQLSISNIDLIDNNQQIIDTQNMAELNSVVRTNSTGVSQESSSENVLDRLTLEITKSADQKNTHVIWLLDASLSLTQQRNSIRDRIGKILGEIKTNNPKHNAVHSVVSFGKDMKIVSTEPLSDPEVLKEQIESIVLDESGIENIFGSVYNISNKRYKDHRSLIIVFTDEAGDDIDMLDKAITSCRKYGTIVHVVGSPAPFGKTKAQFRFVEFDPKYESFDRWVEINQGPETLYPTILDIRSVPEDNLVLDSGFGPFALSSLCLNTGGIYFSVHSDRSEEIVSQKNISPLSVNINKFFNYTTMMKYKPDYRSATAQIQEISNSKIKSALVRASSIKLDLIHDQTVMFNASSDGEFVKNLNKAQEFSAKIEPKINEIYNMLFEVEKYKTSLKDDRWIASYNLAMGKVLFVKSRIEYYNALLAEAKSGLKKNDMKTNQWQLHPTSNITIKNSQINKNLNKAKEYLEYIIDNYPDTPWAYLAESEIKTPFGYEWKENYVEPKKIGGGTGNNNLPKDDMIKKLQPKPQRKIDKI